MTTIKAFIEFDSPEAAQLALKGSDGYKNPFHRIVCYKSNLPEIKFKNENSNCARDFSNAPLVRANTVPVASPAEKLNKFKLYQKAKSHELYFPKESGLKEGESVVKLGVPSGTELYEDVQRSMTLLETDTHESLPAELSFDGLESFSQEVGDNEKGLVLYVKGFSSIRTTPSHVYNLFSNFGNITMILYFKDSGSSLIEFESNLEAATAKHYAE